MRTFIALTLLVCLTAAASQEKHTYAINQVSAPIKVDGVIDATEWQSVTPIELPFETFPGNNIAARVKTEAFLAYDEKNLYAGFRAYDPNLSALRAHLTDRDRAYQDDFLGIAVDTFNDERRAFEFFVNPLGVQMDLTNNDLNGNEDDSWDAIWSSAGKVLADRWEVEMAIPFSQLRFKAADVQTWGIDILRIYPREQRYRMGLHPQNRDRSCYVCQMSKLTGFRGITPGRNIEISPTLTTQRTDARPDDLRGPLQSGSFDTEPGVTARWGVTPNMTLNAAVNPDFSQVEADSAQLDINNTFALFFNEKRPFFLEGADFFDTPFSTVYTRTVAAPDWGAKVTGKQGAHGGGAFFARDAKTNLLLPGSQGSSLATLDTTNITGVLRYRRDIGKSNVGALFTTRSGEDYSNRVAGFDGNFRLSERDTIIAQALASRTEYPNEIVNDFGEKPSMSGEAFYARYRHSSRNWFWHVRLEHVGEDFRADSGFMPRVNYDFELAGLERTWWPKDGQKTWWTRIFWGGDYDKTTELSTSDVLEEEWESWVAFGGPKQSFLQFDVGTRDRFFNGRAFNGEKFVNIYGEISPHKRLYFELSINAGDQIDFDNTRPATRLRLNPYMRFRATRSLELQLSHVNEKLNVDEGRLYTANLTELRAMYQFNIRTFLRALVQYTDIDRDPALYTFPIDAKSKLVFPQLLFSYKVNPQTVLFVGYSSTRVGDERIDVTEADRTLFVKVGYAWAL